MQCNIAELIMCCSTCRFVDVCTTAGFSALHYAAFHGLAQVATVLLEAGANALLPTSSPNGAWDEGQPLWSGCNALHLAACQGHNHMINVVLEGHVSRADVLCVWMCGYDFLSLYSLEGRLYDEGHEYHTICTM